MVAVAKFPITLEERLEFSAGEVRWPSTFDEFVELLEEADYNIEYQNREIIAMSIASDPHEKMVANILGILYVFFKDNNNLHRYGSNRHVFAPAELVGEPTAFSPDISMVKGQPQIFEYAKGKTANLNPFLVIEIISKSSRRRDLREKLPVYQAIPSLECIVFLEQNEPFVSVWKRRENGVWAVEDFDELDQFFEIEGQKVALADIYRNVVN